jgi:hypothetical protein
MGGPGLHLELLGTLVKFATCTTWRHHQPVYCYGPQSREWHGEAREQIAVQSHHNQCPQSAPVFALRAKTSDARHALMMMDKHGRSTVHPPASLDEHVCLHELSSLILIFAWDKCLI